MTTEERVLEENRMKRTWQAGFEAARHHANHTEPILSVVWHGDVPEIVPNWKIGQHRPGWIT